MKQDNWRNRRYFLLASVAVVVGLFLVPQSLNVELHAQHSRILLQLKELDARLDRDVLQVTSFLLNHYDSLAETAKDIRRLTKDLRDPEHRLYARTEPAVGQAMESCLEALEQKLVLVERIKFEAAVLRNGLQYLPTVAKEVQQYDERMGSQVADLLNRLYRVNLFHSADEGQRIADQIDRLAASSAGHSHQELLDNIFLHMRANLTELTELAELKKRFLKVPAKQRFADLNTAYNAYHTANVRYAKRLSIGLLVTTVLLLGLLGWLWRHLDATRDAAQNAWTRLRDAVESVNEAFALVDADGKLVLYNRKWREFYPWLRGLSRDSTWLDIREANADQIQYEEIEKGTQLHETDLEQRNGRYVEQLYDGRWYLASDNETSDGGQACVRVDITQSKRIEQELRKLSRALEQSPASVVITDTEGTIEYVNPKFEQISGYTAEQAIGQNPRMLKSGDKKPEEYETLWETISSGREWRGIFHNKRKDGSIYWESASISGLRGDNGEITHYIAVKEDITARKRAEEQLRMNATVFDTASEGIIVTDANNRIKTVNPAFSRISGYEPEDVIGRDPKILSSGRHGPGFYREMWEQIDGHGHWSGEIWNRRKDGSVYPEWLSVVVIRDEKTDVVKEYVAVFSDISQRKQDEEQIRRQANFDALTGLPNRSLFFDRLNQAVIAARREHGLLALLFLDLDRFKAVNDTFGHMMGDELLQEVAKRLNSSVRDSDTVARLGGDEFVVLIHDLGEVNDAASVADKIVEQMSLPFSIGGREVALGASVGITIYPEDTEDAEEMMRNADMAMYRAKEGGRNRYQFFTVGMQEQVRERLELEQDLRLALDRDELMAYYQPIVDSRTGEIQSVEALLRWDHPKLGFVPPDTFIPLAEESGLSIALGNWVARKACRVLRRWRDDGIDVNVSVNVSSRQRSKEFSPWTVSGLLKEYGVRGEWLTLEITEGLLMDDSPEVVSWLNGFRDLGIGLSVDDFGTGYSSLSYLKRFPVNVIKIDRAFVRGLPDDAEDVSLVEAILAMGKSLGLKVVAEGVETEQQYQFLRQRNCDYLQGFYFGKPMLEPELRTWLAEQAEAAQK